MRKDVRYLEYMSRHGLDGRVVREYKSCGMLYFSRRYDDRADIDRFIDIAGVDRSIIKKVDELEAELCIVPYHIIWNSSKELVIMYYDADIDLDYQFDQFKQGKCTAIRYFIQNDTWEYTDLHYEVVLGAVIDTDFTLN